MPQIPPCPYFGPCGGCQLQDMTYEEQLAHKQAWLMETLRGLVEEEKVRPILASPRAWNYRRRIQLHVGPKGEVGFYGSKSRQVVPIETCLIAEEALNAKIPEVRNRAAEVLRQPRKPTSLTYELTLLDDGEVEISREGEERSFVQVNSEANQILIEILRKALEEIRPARVLELFAGSGNLTYALAKPEQTWIAVESDRRAVEAGIAKQGNDFPHLSWKAGPSAKVAGQLYKAKQAFDLILLDPPRGGAEDCLPVLRSAKPPRILYVSCNPLVFKKDLKVLIQAGYEVESIQPIDFFPQMTNLELLAALRQK
ncbi:MAG TPA: RsmD family RNA methyltransferase [bacterium]|nr:RsmD family RNA methyltransferase [bacterium]